MKMIVILLLLLPSQPIIYAIEPEPDYTLFFSLQTDNCVSVDCVKEKVRMYCEEDPAERLIFIDCYTILKCLDVSEQVKEACAGGPYDGDFRKTNVVFS